jgi:hypothetical protein
MLVMLITAKMSKLAITTSTVIGLLKAELISDIKYSKLS